MGDETEAFGDLLRELAAEGCGILMVEHDMDLVFAFAERIAVMAAGRISADGPPAAIAADPAVRAVYLGEAADA